MIGAAAWEAYCAACSKVSTAASTAVEKAVAEWCSANPSASTADAREAAKAIMDSIVPNAEQAGASLSAAWYDALAGAAGVELPQAVTTVCHTQEEADAVARYQAGKYSESPVAFARACGEYASNATNLAINRTIMANVERDGGKGVRFARVTSGTETCPFCLMLAGRGAVYHTRKTAGEFGHYHRRCDCKVVPGFGGDPSAVLVEGHDPSAIQRAQGLVEHATGLSFESRRDSRRLEAYLGLVDKDWLLGGTPCKITRQQGAKPLEKEIRVAECLRGLGWDIEFVKEANTTGVKTADAVMNGAIWEFKVPEGWSSASSNSLQGEHTVRKQFYKALGKGTEKLVLSNDLTGADFEAMVGVVRRVLASGDYAISEVLVVDSAKCRIEYMRIPSA